MAGEIDLILTRLQLCNDDITGITSFKLPPSQAETTYPPFIYALPPSYSEERFSAFLVVKRWEFPLELMVRPFEENIIVIADETSTGVNETITYVERVIDYYNSHRRLSTDALASLEFITKDVLLQATPQFPLTGHDGGLYFGVTFNLQIEGITETS